MRMLIVMVLLMAVAACSGHKPLQADVVGTPEVAAPQVAPDVAPATPTASADAVQQQEEETTPVAAPPAAEPADAPPGS